MKDQTAHVGEIFFVLEAPEAADVNALSPSRPAGQRRHGLHGGLRQAAGVLAHARPGRGALSSRLLRAAGHPGLQLVHPVSPGGSRRHPEPGEEH